MSYTLATGALVDVPTTRTSAKGNQFLSGKIKESDDDGRQYIGFVCFRESVQAELANLTEGDIVSIQGKSKIDSWTGRDNVARYSLNITVEKVMVLEKSQESAKAVPRAQKRTLAPAPVDTDDDIPF